MIDLRPIQNAIDYFGFNKIAMIRHQMKPITDFSKVAQIVGTETARLQQKHAAIIQAIFAIDALNSIRE